MAANNHTVLRAIRAELDEPRKPSADRLRAIHKLIVDFWPELAS